MKLFSGVALRLYVVMISLFSAFVGFVEPRSLMYMIASTGTPGQILLWVFVVLGVFGIADVVINDVLPDEYVLKPGLRWRHLIYMSLALAYVIELFIGYRYAQAWATFPIFVVHAVFAAVAAFVDVLHRFANSGPK